MKNFESQLKKERIRWWLKSHTSESIGFLGALTIWSLILFFFGYVALNGYYAIKYFGFINIFGKTQFSLNKKEIEVSFWAPFATTVFLAAAVAFVSIPIGRRCALFISFFVKPKYKKIISSILLFFANLPSIVLGLFCRDYLAIPVKNILGLNSSMNLITAVAALSCMILPLIISLFMSEYKEQKHMILGSKVLGMNVNQASYKLIFPKTKKTIYTVTAIVVARVFNESIMLSLLLSSENYSQIYGQGFGTFINSQLNSIAPLISANFYADGSQKNLQSLMMLFGGLLIWSSIFFNIMCFICMKFIFRKKKETSRIPISRKIKWYFLEKWIFRSAKNLGIVEKSRKIIEYFCVFLYSSFVICFLGITIWNGIFSIGKTGDNDGLWRSMMNIFIIIIISMFCACPIAITAAFFLSECCKKDSKFRKATLSLVNSGASSPSILFGIVGLSFFIQKLGLTSEGSKGKSILAGLLTIILLIIPHLTKLFYTHLDSINKKYREASYILGINKLNTFTKIILPKILNDLIFSSLFITGRIMGETIPFSLTTGLNNSNQTRLMYPGQTLSTRIRSQIYETDLTKATAIINETTLVCLALIFTLVIIGKWIVPNINKSNIRNLVSWFQTKRLNYAI